MRLECGSVLCMSCFVLVEEDVVFFKQKTAYGLGISDWSSDVCSSDLKAAAGAQFRHRRARKSGRNSVTIKARNASVAIIGAGDYIGAAIAKRFAREGF